MMTAMAPAFSLAYLAIALLLVALVAGAIWIATLRRQVRAAEESASRFRWLFERSPDAAMLFETTNSTFVDCNQAALALLRCDKTWPLGKHPWDLAPAQQPCGTPSFAKAGQIIAGLQHESAVRFEWQHGRADGTDFPAEISLTGVEFGKQPMFLAVLRDVTAWKQAQAQVEEANVRLEGHVAERTAELADANVRLERAVVAERELSNLKSAFVSMVSH